MGHGGTARADSAAWSLAARSGPVPGSGPCACGLARGHRYLTRFSTEYTDM